MQVQHFSVAALLALLPFALADIQIGTVSVDPEPAATAGASGLAATTSASEPAATTSAAEPAATTDSGDSSGGPFGLSGPCFPKGQDGTIDKTAPCRAAEIIAFKCLIQAHGGGDNISSDNPDDQSQLDGLGPLNATLDQQCFCQSNQPGSTWWENAEGCQNCRRLHGESQEYFPPRLVASLSSDFCGVAQPTVDLANYLDGWIEKQQTVSMAPSETPSDVLGTQTAISAYFTSTPVASSTGAAASGGPTSASSGAAAPGMTAAPLGGAVAAGILGLAVLL